MDGQHISRPVLFFDGVCNLCDATVQYIIRHDKKKQFLFASLQSDAGRQALKDVPGAATENGSVVLWYKNHYYLRSNAVLKVCRLLGGWHMLLLTGYIIPPFIRDALYNYIARNRYKWHGRKDACMIPTAELKSRFLE